MTKVRKPSGIKIINTIIIDGKEHLWDDLSPEDQKKYSQILAIKFFGALGYVPVKKEA